MQTTKENRLETGKGVTRLNTRQIQRICRKQGWHCEMRKEPNVPNSVANNHRYRKCNAVVVARGGDWLPLGWRWDIEVMDEAQIVELLKTLEQAHNNELSGSTGTTGGQA